MHIHLIENRDSPDHCSVNKKELILYEFTLWGRDLVSVVHIRETPYYSGFSQREYILNFVGTLKTVHKREASVLERCPYLED